MSRDVILKDDGGTRFSYDNIRGGGYKWGEVSGVDSASGWLNEKAVELFRIGKDSEAVALRELAKELRATLGKESRRMATVHDEQYPAIVSEEEE